MGNDDQLLELLRQREGKAAVRDLVALSVATSRGLGVKCINAGGASAFKDGMLNLSLDEEIPVYGLTTRKIMNALLDAVEEIGVPHPLHVHANNLGIPGADDSFVATMEAAEGRRIHFAHAQFYAYGAADPANPATGGFRSAAEANHGGDGAAPQRHVRRGSVAFGQTVTISLERDPPVRRPQGREPEEVDHHGGPTRKAAASCRSCTSRAARSAPCNGRSASN